MKTLIFHIKSNSIYLLAPLVTFSVLFATSLVLNKNEAKGDVIQNNTAGTWEGTLGPTQADVAENSSIVISQNSSTGLYEGKLGNSSIVGHVTSSTIAPNNSFKAWQLVNVNIKRPANVPIGNSNITVDILCGDQVNNCGATAYNNPFPGFVNLNPANGVVDISSIVYNKIRLRANWYRQNTSTESSALIGWTVSWSVNSSFNLVVSKTPNPANPVPFACETGCGLGLQNNSIVTYTLNYAIDSDANNLVLRLPRPTATFSGRNYSVQYVSSTQGGRFVGNEVWWVLGPKPQGTVGSVSASFRVLTGPPDGTVFKTRGRIQNYDAGGNVTIDLTSVEDRLLISSISTLESRLLGPEYISPGTKVTFLLEPVSGGVAYQGDVFNAQHVFSYPSGCFNFDSATGGAYSQSSGQVSFTTGNFYFYPPQTYYTVTLNARNTCATPNIQTSWEIFSDQDSSFYPPYKRRVLNSIFDASDTARFSMNKFTWSGVTSPGQVIDYGFRFEQRSSYPINNFYAIEPVPAQTTFLYVNYSPAYFSRAGVQPNASNPISVYTSESSSQPAKNDPSWTLVSGGGLPCPFGCAPANPSAVKWVKWETNGLYWDIHENGEWQMGSMRVLVNSGASGEIVDTTTYFGSNVCSGGCPSNTVRVPITNRPYFTMDYVANPNPVTAGQTSTITGFVRNADDYNGRSTSDAKNVRVTFMVPHSQFINPITSARATCDGMPLPSSQCPDVNGNVVNASWLNGTYDPVASTVTWDIPLIYNGLSTSGQQPWSYSFRINLSMKTGPADGTVAQCWDTTTSILTDCKIKVSGWNSDLSEQVNQEKNITSPLIINSSPQLNVCKTASPTLIDYQGVVTYRFSYSNVGSGAADNFFVLDRVPVLPTNPPSFLIFDSLGTTNDPNGINTPNGVNFYWSNFSGPRPTSSLSDPNANWQPITPSSPTNAQKPSVTWIMFKKSSLEITSAANLCNQNFVEIRMRDNGSPNGTQFLNTPWIGYIDKISGSEIGPVTQSGATVTVSNPGFIETRNGDVGSVNNINLRKAIPAGYHTTDYLGIAKSINTCCFSSVRNWLVHNTYNFNTPSITYDYDKLWPDYKDKATACSSPNTCFGTNGVKIYNGPLPFVIDSTVSNNPFSQAEPLLLFIDGGSSDPAMQINTNFGINNNTGVIFVVKGNVRVHPTVQTLDGVFVVSGNFSTGTSSSSSTNRDAGKYAAIKIGQDGMARIVYLSDNDVRFIRCRDIDCRNRSYTFLSSLTQVTSIFMELDPQANGQDLPKIVFGQSYVENGNKRGQVYYVNCTQQDCLTKDIVKIDDAIDPDIVLDPSQGYRPLISEGLIHTSTNTTRLAFVSCHNPSTGATDKTCRNRQRILIDAQGQTGSIKDVGNDTQIELNSQFRPVITHVKRDGNQVSLLRARRMPNNGNTTCSLVNSWDCAVLASSPQGDVGKFPSLKLAGGVNVREAYNNSSQFEMQYLSCGNAQCSAGQTTITDVDCLAQGGNQACEVQDYVSLVLNPSDQPRIVYNVKPKYQGGSDPIACQNFTCYDIRYAYFNGSSWEVNKIVSFKRGLPPTGVEPGAQVFTQALDLGTGGPESAFDNTRDYPRIVYYDGDQRDLLYVRCSIKNCSAGSFVPLNIDDGGSILVKDTPLTVNGSVIAYNLISLQRDLYDSSGDYPAETFVFQPRYLYIFRNIWVGQVIHQETTP